MDPQAFVEELRWRGLVMQVSDEEGLLEYLGSGQKTLYCGFDPTADSLHIGSLVPLLALRRFQEQGHRPLLLLGGATGLIGDPSGRDDERSLNGSDTVGLWVEALRAQVERFLDFEAADGSAAKIVNNLDWTAGLDVIDFLRDIGKHFSVNSMIKRESVKARLERDDQGISYCNIKTLIGINILWGIICFYGYFVTTPTEFYIAAGFIGLGMGGIQSLSRSTYSKLIDIKYSTSYFSFYDVSQKLSIVLGTAIYATMDVYTGSIRLAILIFALFFIPSILLLNQISKK